jgi:hypothetical protein
MHFLDMKRTPFRWATTRNLRKWSSHTTINQGRGSHLKLDRKYQLELLEMLEPSYPSSFSAGSYIRGLSEEGRDRYAANMYYLHEHGLVKSDIKLNFATYILGALPRITNEGRDFLAGDGDLSAILGVVTIKLHDETIRHLISRKIDESDLSPVDKRKWTDALQSLPADSIKHLTMKLLDKGVSQMPDVIHLINSHLSHFG